MNLYGFAGGDPVNFSDPFGLCPPLEPCPVRAGTFMGAALNGIGSAISTWWDAHKDNVIMAVGMVLTEGRSEWEGLTPATIRGKSMQEVEEMVPQSWARQPTAREGKERGMFTSLIAASSCEFSRARRRIRIP
ncbi:hypothetical protein BH11GEM2_BH11GEM2_34980 [soil metagenome]